MTPERLKETSATFLLELIAEIERLQAVERARHEDTEFVNWMESKCIEASNPPQSRGIYAGFPCHKKIDLDCKQRDLSLRDALRAALKESHG